MFGYSAILIPMFLKPTRSGGHTYLQLVESFRNESGQPRQRTVATLGRLDEVGGGVDSLLAGLLRHKGLPGCAASPPQLEFDAALSFGDVALDQIWCELGFDALAGVFRKARFTTAVEHALRVMVFNRLCDADSKLGVLRWLQTVYMPQIDTAALTHQQLLRSMDALMDHHTDVDAVVACLLRPLVDQDMSMVFYDLTTIRAAGLSEQLGDVRQYGMAKEGVIARQFMLGVVQTAEGLPIYHEVFDGNQAEGPTLLPTLRKVIERVRVHGVARQAVAIFGRAGDACGARTSRSVASARGHDGKWPRQQTRRQRFVDPGHDCLVHETPQVHALAQARLMDAEPTR